MVTIRLTQDFKEFLSLLNSKQVEYLVIGGYAVATYGYVRPTKDIDVWIAVSEQNLHRLVDALIAFGFPPSAVTVEVFKSDKSVFRMGYPPNRLEILTRITGVDFQECYQRRGAAEIDGLSVPVISLGDLLANKTAAGREQDRVDVAKLKQFHGKSRPA